MTTQKLPYSLGWIVAQAIETVKDPRGVAARMMKLGLPVSVLWQALALVVTISVLLGQGTLLLTAGDGAALVIMPLPLALLQFTLLGVMVLAIHTIGRAMGGVGGFDGALTLVVWLQIVMVCLQLVQSVSFLLIPPFAVVLGYAGLVLFLWLLTNFVAVLHGFQSLGIVFVMILMSAFAIAFVISLLLAIVGVVPPGGLNV